MWLWIWCQGKKVNFQWKYLKGIGCEWDLLHIRAQTALKLQVRESFSCTIVGESAAEFFLSSREHESWSGIFKACIPWFIGVSVIDTGLSVTPLMGHLGCLVSRWLSVSVKKHKSNQNTKNLPMQCNPASNIALFSNLTHTLPHPMRLAGLKDRQWSERRKRWVTPSAPASHQWMWWSEGWVNCESHRGYAVVRLSPVIEAVGVTSITLWGNAYNSD